MNAYNPLETSKRLEAAGLERRQAETIASEIGLSKADLVTNESFDIKLDAALAKQTGRYGLLTSAIVGVATAILGLLISIK